MSLEKPDLLHGNKPVKASNITWSCDDVSQNESSAVQIVARQAGDVSTARTTICPSCGHNIEVHQNQGVIHDLPAGVKFDPNDQEILEHLEAKVVAADAKNKRHPLIDEFIPTLKGENGICYTHPKKLPGVSKDGQLRHFFHQPSKAYTTGTRKRRKVLSDENGSETRWHKTGKTRPVVANGTVKGFKKILVLYTNYGKQRKPGKTNWVMHQYHLGDREEEKDGEMVVSKVFYQTQPRQCGSTTKDEVNKVHPGHVRESYTTLVKYFNNNNSNSNNNNNTKTFISYDKKGGEISSQLLPNLTTHGDGESSFIRCATDSSKGKIS